jgi:hypothetical protein
MLVKDVIKILLDFPMGSQLMVLTNQEDLEGLVTKKFPELKFGTIKIGSKSENPTSDSSEDVAVVIVDDFTEKNSTDVEAVPVEEKEGN